jgi:hypothetical protein
LQIRILLGLATLGCALGQTASPKLPPHVKLVPELRTGPAAPPTVVAQPTPAPPPRCGHIIVYGSKAARDPDPKFTIPVPATKSNMPVIQGLPPCPENVR